MKAYLRSIFILCICFACSNNKIEEVMQTEGAFIDDWTYEFYNLEAGANAKFKLWLPPNIKPRATLVLSIGGGGNGTNLVDLEIWRAYAKKEKLALLGIHLTVSTINAPRTLLKGLTKITAARDLSYISELPFLLRGHSSGGYFSYNFAAQYPNRTIAYANIKGRMSDPAHNLPPGLLIVGEKDLAARNNSIKEFFFAKRQKSGVICLAIEPDAGHSVGNSDPLIRAFFTAVLEKRLKNDELIDISEEESYLGNITTFNTASFQSFLGEKENASCTINAEFSSLWTAFVN